MKFLVTGATGLLGNSVVRALLAQGHSVRVLTRATSDARPLADLDVEKAQGDVRQADAVRRACQGVDAVIHSAAHVHIGWSQSDVQYEINVSGTRNVAEGARAAGARMVHVSSINALGLGSLHEPADEDSPLPGIVECPYVLTKREAERVVLEQCARGLHASIVNPTLMFGPYDWKPSSGQMLLEVAKGVPIAPRGAANFGDVRDVAAGCIAAAQRGAVGRRYVLGAHNATYMELWQHMARITGAKPPRIRLGPVVLKCAGAGGDLWTRLTGKEGSVNSAMIGLSNQTHCFSSARAQRELGYSIRPLEESLQDEWRWLLENGYVKSAQRKAG